MLAERRAQRKKFQEKQEEEWLAVAQEQARASEKEARAAEWVEVQRQASSRWETSFGAGAGGQEPSPLEQAERESLERQLSASKESNGVVPEEEFVGAPADRLPPVLAGPVEVARLSAQNLDKLPSAVGPSEQVF